MKDPKQILVVDSDPEAIRRAVECLGPHVRASGAETAEDALRQLEDRAPDLVVLELRLRDLSGLGLLRLIREHPRCARTAVFVVSDQASEIDRVLAFEGGADDFLAKPYYAPEFAVRVRTLLRAFETAPGAGVRTADRSGAVRIDPSRGSVEVLGRQVGLTPTEVQILATLVAEQGRVVRRRELIRRLRGVSAEQGERAIDAHVKSIRRKLGEARGILETVRGVGYRFREPPEVADPHRDAV